MPAHAKGCVDRPENREETLGLLQRLKALHLPFLHTSRLVRVLGSVIEVAALPVLNVGQDHSFLGSVAPELVRDDDACALCAVWSSLRKKRKAAQRSRLGCTKISMTAPF